MAKTIFWSGRRISATSKFSVSVSRCIRAPAVINHLGGSTQLHAISEWAKNLYGQLAKEQGLDHIQFFNITQNPLQAGKRRIHPTSDVMREEFIDVVMAPGPFEFEYHFKEPLETASLWISTDGDDTKSEYEVLISDLELTTAN